MRENNRTRSVVLCGLSIALLAVGAFITLPLGPVPFTLQTLMLILIVTILTPGESIVAVAGYLVLGAIGLPVFSGMRGGFAVLAGPTGGFLIGFLVGTVIVALIRIIVSKRARSLSVTLGFDVLTALAIMIVSYGLGSLWFVFSTGSTFQAALALCVVPFLVPDAIKAIAALTCAQPVRVALGRASWRQYRKVGPERS
jgi:biotin transport system substrate-specific component